MMERQEKIFQHVTKYLTIGFILFGLVMTIYNLFYSTPYYIALSAASILFAFIPAVVYKIFRLKPVYSLTFLSDLFCILAFTIGMVFHGYATLPGFDKFVHTLSGVFFALVGLGLYYLLKPDRTMQKSDGPQAIVFSVSFAMLIAVVWEIFEYAINLVLHNDPQKVLNTGVNDTMLDMIVCLIGALFLAICMYFYYQKGKKEFFMRTFEIFCIKNIQRK